MSKAIVEYSSSESDSNDDDDSKTPSLNLHVLSLPNGSISNHSKSKKREISNSNQIQGDFDVKRQKISGDILPVPSSIHDMFDHKKWIDDPLKHGGRVRSFEHVAGNWPTHVYIQYKSGDLFEQLVDDLMMSLDEFQFEKLPEYHISLSRTVTIRRHWIDPLTQSLTKLEKVNRFICALGDCRLFVNDERTRTFISLHISDPTEKLDQLRRLVDECFMEFNLQKYYENPSYHISLGWCLGDVVDKIENCNLDNLQEIVSAFLEDNPDISILKINEVHSKIGNKFFSYSLQGG